MLKINYQVSKLSSLQEELLNEIKDALTLAEIKSSLKQYQYTIKNNYLCKVINRKDEIEYQKISNFISIVTKEIYLDDGLGRLLKSYRIEGVNLFTQEKFPSTVIPAESFNNKNWIQNSWGMKAIIEPGNQNVERVKHVTQLLSQNCLEETFYTHFGWRKVNSKWVYLHYNGAIGNDSLKIEIDEKVTGLNNYILKNNGDESTDIDSLKFTLSFLQLANESVTYPLFSLIWLAPLCEILKQAKSVPKFTLWLLGETGSRKSAIASCMLNFFGNFKNGVDYPASFKDTVNALEKKAHITKDFLLVVDDFHPTSTKSEKSDMEQKAQSLLRGYGDRVGKSRMRSDLSLATTFFPRGVCLVTGENPPSAGASTTARYLGIDMKGIDLDRLTSFEENSFKASNAMVLYINWLACSFEEKINEFSSLFRVLRKDFSSYLPHGRYLDSIIWLYIGFKTFLEFILEKDVITEEKYNTLESNGKSILFKVGTDNVNEFKETDPIELFIEALDTLLVTKNVTILPDKVEPCEQTKKFIGWEDDDYYYLIMDVTYAAINEFYIRNNEIFPLAKKTLLKMCNQKGLLIPASQGRTVGVHNINGNQKRVAKFIKSQLALYKKKREGLLTDLSDLNDR